VTDPDIEPVAVAICQALGLNPNDAATPPAPGLPGLRWTQFVAPAAEALSMARIPTGIYDPDALPPLTGPSVLVRSFTAEDLGVTDDDMARAKEAFETSERVASIAARGLSDPASLSADEIRSVCASALVQA
jgi:hypothetical protein